MAGTCEVCGASFTYWPTRRYRRRSCSPKCQGELKRKAQADRHGKANPNHRHGRQVGERDREGERRWYAALGRRCMVPGCQTPHGGARGLYLHHVLYRQAIKREGGDVWDVRNAFTICGRCHGRHHTRSGVIPLAALPDSAFAFAFELLGLAAWGYLHRRYAGNDPRLDALVG